jgi:hypothetical protein
MQKERFVFKRIYRGRYYLLFGLLLGLISFSPAIAQTTTFTYQGKLNDGGAPANGSYDLQFALFPVPASGDQIGATIARASVIVTSGVFTVPLDFGATAFPGADRYLEISVRPAGSTGAYTTLAPRQQITSTPYAIRSLSTASADNVSVGGVPAGNGNYIQNMTTPQAGANYNISGGGTAGGTLSANVVNAATQYNIGGSRVLSVTGSSNLFGSKQRLLRQWGGLLKHDRPQQLLLRHGCWRK